MKTESETVGHLFFSEMFRVSAWGDKRGKVRLFHAFTPEPKDHAERTWM